MSRPDYPAAPRRRGSRAAKRGGDPPETLRCFAAVFPPAAVREALVDLRRRLEPAFPGLRWVAPGSLHFTLRFFGDLTREEAERAGDVLAGVAVGTVPFTLELAGLGVFPHWNRPRVLWVGCGHGGRTLEALARTLERGFREARLGRADKAFKAHLTLGRWRDTRGLDLREGRARSAEVARVTGFQVEEAGVIQSTLDPGGAIYRPLHVSRFAGVAPPPASPEG
jgi:2'-5' RNA ligase